MLFAHTSHMLDYDDNMSEGGCQSQTVKLKIDFVKSGVNSMR